MKKEEEPMEDQKIESYDTVLDDVIEEDDEENAEAEYEGVSEDVLNDHPPL